MKSKKRLDLRIMTPYMTPGLRTKSMKVKFDNSLRDFHFFFDAEFAKMGLNR